MRNSGPSFREALRFWLRLGFISFGGPAGQIALMHRVVVEEKKWISESRFLHALHYCMLLPGPEAQQLATYIGWLMHGRRGGLAAGLLFILPSVFILLGLSIVYVRYGQLPVASALFRGLQPAVVALVLHAFWRLSKKTLKGVLPSTMALLAFAGIFFFHISFPLLVAGALVSALLLRYRFPHWWHSVTGPEALMEQGKISDMPCRDPHPPSRERTGGWPVLLLWVLLWLLPIGALYLTQADFAFWKQLCLFFTRAAFVTFGGAYAVLPYVAQMSVEKFQWLSSAQMMDGMALGETTPGPLIMVLAFTGFMAAYGHFGYSIYSGTLGLFITTFYTFLPSFAMVLTGAPYIERSRGNERLREALSLVSAAVAGVMLHLALYLAKAVVWRGYVDYAALLWIALSVLALERFRVNLLWWLLLSAVAGLVRHYAGV